MRAPGICAATAALVLLSGCTSGSEASDAKGAEERVERLAEEPPAELVAGVLRALDKTAARVSVAPAGAAEASHTLVIGRDAWRVETPPPAVGDGDEAATLLVADDQVCFDHGFRPRVSQQVAASYGVVEFDPQPWTCTKAGFGLNTMATFAFQGDDPRGRIRNLITQDPGAYTAEPEQVDDRHLLHVHTPGTTASGPLDLARPIYDLWVDSDLRPVRMETEDLSWEFDYPAGLDSELALPPEEERGSYGYALGPGQAEVKACLQWGYCPESGSGPRLLWGDGRERESPGQ